MEVVIQPSSSSASRHFLPIAHYQRSRRRPFTLRPIRILSVPNHAARHDSTEFNEHSGRFVARCFLDGAKLTDLSLERQRHTLLLRANGQQRTIVLPDHIDVASVCAEFDESISRISVFARSALEAEPECDSNRRVIEPSFSAHL